MGYTSYVMLPDKTKTFCEQLVVETKAIPVTGPPLWSSGQSSWLHNGDVLCLL
jgi:hypothetical protein